jgi:hypothetical protein
VATSGMLIIISKQHHFNNYIINKCVNAGLVSYSAYRIDFVKNENSFLLLDTSRVVLVGSWMVLTSPAGIRGFFSTTQLPVTVYRGRSYSFFLP